MQQEAQYENFSRTLTQGAEQWVRALVERENQILRATPGESVSYDDHRRIVKDGTRDYLLELRDEFTKCAELFNTCRGGSHLPNSIKIFNVSNTQGDFILFRNTLKLVISNPSIGVINFAFASRSAALPKPSSTPGKREGYDLIAQIFPFNEIAWTFHGEKVNAKSLVRYMFTEFVQASASVSI